MAGQSMKLELMYGVTIIQETRYLLGRVNKFITSAKKIPCVLSLPTHLVGQTFQALIT